MAVSLIITTYNWETALHAVLQSVTRQILLPDEVIIADDGSPIDHKLTLQRSLMMRLAPGFRKNPACRMLKIAMDEEYSA